MRGYDDMKKIMLVVGTAALLMILVYQGSMAFFHAETNLGAKVSAGNLGIELVEQITDKNVTKTEDGYQIGASMPGEKINNAVYVENKKDYSLYARVTATKYWVDESGKKLSDADASLITLHTKDPSNWIVIDDSANSNAEVVYFYYKLPINKGEKSTNLVDAIEISKNIKNGSYSTYQIHLSFEADAIQSIAGADAALSEWGVEFVLDDKGNLVSVDE